jgi:GTP-binding protein
MTSAKPKVGDYPFTTLTPNLGIVDLGDYRSCTMADIPGLIEGASTGKGLGHAFLRHVERTRVLVYLLDVTDEPVERYRVLRREVERYADHLGHARRVVCLNKIDLWPPDEPLPDVHGEPVLGLSAATGGGVDALRDRLKLELSLAPDELPVRAPETSAEPTAETDPDLPDDIDDF